MIDKFAGGGYRGKSPLLRGIVGSFGRAKVLTRMYGAILLTFDIFHGFCQGTIDIIFLGSLLILVLDGSFERSAWSLGD